MLFGLSTLELGLILFVLAALWVSLSKDKLATTIKSMLRGKKHQMARELDDAALRLESADAKLIAQLAQSNGGKVDVKSAKHVLLAEMTIYKRALDRAETQAQNAAAQDRPDLLALAVKNKKAALDSIANTQPVLDKILADEKRMMEAIQITKDTQSNVVSKKLEVKVAQKSAKATIAADKLVAGMNHDGINSDIAAADEMLKELRGEQAAWAEISQEVKDEKTLQEELNALADGQSVEDEMAAYMAEYGPKATE